MRKPGDRMYTTEYVIPYEVFSFSGQSEIDVWNIREMFHNISIAKYSNWLVEEIPLCLLQIRRLADDFPFWQHCAKTGRPSISERILMIGYLVKQFFQATFRQTEGLLRLLKDFFQIQKVPDHTVFSRKNRSKRWLVIWKRFHKYVLNRLPSRSTTVATDATGFSGRKVGWNDVPYQVKANQDWVKLHATVETGFFFILSYELSKSNVHDSQKFEDLWINLPKNVEPNRSLADSAYSNHDCTQVARDLGATPYHGIKKNAILHLKPVSPFEKMINFGKHFPNRYAEIYNKRNHVETVFSMIGSRFGHRIRCRTKIGRKNEVQTKLNSHNIRMLALPLFMMSF